MIQTEPPIDLAARRRKLPGIDNPVLQHDVQFPNGKAYQSTTFVTELGRKPHVLSSCLGADSGVQTMITVNVEPIQGTLPGMAENCYYECVTKYENYTNSPIKVTDRHNISFTLPKLRFLNPHQIERLVVRKIHRINSAEVAMSILYNHGVCKRYLTVPDEERHTVISSLLEAQAQGEFKRSNFGIDITIDRIIPIKLLQHYASIYVHDVDMLFQFDDIDIGTPHPTSQDALLQGQILEQVGDQLLTGAFYEIIDNDNKFMSRYVCLGKDIVQIPINRVPGKEPGIYQTTIDNVNSNQLRITMNHHPLDKAEELGIFPTKEEAETNGHVNEAHKLRMKQLEMTAQEQQRNYDLLKLERDNAVAELAHDRRLKDHQVTVEQSTLTQATTRLESETGLIDHVLRLERKLEEDRIDRNKLQRNEYYEERSAHRKDTSEFVKWIPALLSGGIGVATMLSIQRNNSNRNKN